MAVAPNAHLDPLHIIPSKGPHRNQLDLPLPSSYDHDQLLFCDVLKTHNFLTISYPGNLCGRNEMQRLTNTINHSSLGSLSSTLTSVSFFLLSWFIGIFLPNLPIQRLKNNTASLDSFFLACMILISI